MPAPGQAARRFQLVLIKPSHYDDDGYVIQWWKSAIPSNSLACLYGLATDCAARQVLGPDVAIDITAIDETNTRVDVKALTALLRKHDNFGLIGLVGVQSNQFPRAVDIARPLREAGFPVVIGGFHVSGLLAMLPVRPPDLQEALDLGISLFAGEAEGRLERVLQDAANGALAPIYNHIDDLPPLEDAVTPYLPSQLIKRTLKSHTSFDAGRGCPFQCSFCTIINVQGRKSRRRTPDDVERLIRQTYSEGIRHFFITDDNFARNKDWEPIFDRIIWLREHEKMDVRFIIQVDTLAYKIPNFVEKAARAGVRRVFIGLENINPNNLLAAKKRQNKITEYRAMLLAWKKARLITYAGYILGFPNDTAESIREDIEIIKRELPLDALEFFFLTPLPGSEDHKVLWQKGAWMDPDMNKYDLEHAVAHHQKMSKEEWEGIYRDAWRIYYTDEHMETIFRRGEALRNSSGSLMGVLLGFSKFVDIEGVHPLQGGLFRIKHRTARRPGFRIEPAWEFYPKYWWESIVKSCRTGANGLKIELMRRRVRRDPKKREYMDLALTPVTEGETETLSLFTHNESARNEVVRAHRIAELTHGSREPAPSPAAGGREPATAAAAAPEVR